MTGMDFMNAMFALFLAALLACLLGGFVESLGWRRTLAGVALIVALYFGAVLVAHRVRTGEWWTPRAAEVEAPR